MSESYVGAILAAGRGNRMGALGDFYPKALLPIANQPLIFHHLMYLKQLGIRDIFVLIGYRGQDIVDQLGDGAQHGLQITYVEQGEPLGSAHAVACLAPFIDRPFVLLLGDYYFSAPKLAQIFRHAQEKGLTIMAAKRETDRRALMEACVLELDDKRFIRRIVEKPKVPRNELKGCGIYICQLEFLDAIRRTPRTALRNEYELTTSFDVYIKMGYPVCGAEIIDWDMNFTQPLDVLECNLSWLRNQKQCELIGVDVSMAPGTILDEAIIGDNVRISSSSVFRQSVIFNDVDLQIERNVERVLITPKLTIHCNAR